MKKAYSLLISGLMLMATACQEQASAPTSTTTDAAQEPQQPKAEPELVCEEIRGMEAMVPRSVVYLMVGTEKVFVDSVTVCDDISPDSYEMYQIPSHALQAVGGFWAGAGDYYYLTIQGNDAVVMYGWSDEEVDPSEMYQYKEKKRISLVQ